MLLYWTIFLFITFCAFKDWRHTVILWAPLSLLTNDCVCLKFTHPVVSLSLAVDVMLFFIYVLKFGLKKRHKENYPLKKAFLLTIISYILSSVFGITSISETLTGSIRFFFQGFIILYLFQVAIIKESDLKLFFKVAGVVAIMISGLGLYEMLTFDNPILDFECAQIDRDFLLENNFYYWPGEEGYLRFGLRRNFSFFNIHIFFGCACAILYYLFLSTLVSKERFIKYNWNIIIILALILGIFLSNSKTPIVGLLFFSAAFITIRTLKNPRFILFSAIAIIFVVYFSSDYINNLLALFDPRVAEEGGGSNTAMRAVQFGIGLELFKQNPLIGLGIGATGKLYNVGNVSEILGSESSMLQILPTRGLLGFAAYLLLNWEYYKCMRKGIGKYRATMFVFGVMAMEFATGQLNMFMIGSIPILFYKKHLIDLKSNNN